MENVDGQNEPESAAQAAAGTGIDAVYQSDTTTTQVRRPNDECPMTKEIRIPS
jgi:hypothetical protein